MLSICRGKPRKVTKSRAELLWPNSPGTALRLRARTALQARLPKLETKLRTDQITPLRHNFTLQVMLALAAGVNANESAFLVFAYLIENVFHLVLCRKEIEIGMNIKRKIEY